jgi:HD-GYP domain-containing protein (c-di-GMP phosphodiesterase class II)
MLAEQLVGEARERRARGLPRQEALVRGASAFAFLAIAAAIALLLPSERETSVPVVVGLVLGYAAVTRVRFEFGHIWVTPEQLMLVSMLALAPLPLVPLLVAGASVLAVVPDFVRGEWHWDRTITSAGDCWFVIGPVLLLATLAPGEPQLTDAAVYGLAFATQLGGDLGWMLLRDYLDDGPSFRDELALFAGTAGVDALLTPIAFLIAAAAASQPVSVLAVGPLVWLLAIFSHDRRARYAAALELHRAYRGTVMLLSDVVQFDDSYTAEHSKSVVELVNAVADELNVDEAARQELEFAALLHDVGKIAIAKEILNKPSALTEEEFDIMRTHTIEGQFMLDRVGGLLGRVGEIVRSCHERWDGSGYPDGLAGEEIPLQSRIVFTCDAFNAMTTDRPYRGAMSDDLAFAELRANAGGQFDARVVDAFLRAIGGADRTSTASDHVRAILVSSQSPQGVGVST